MGQQRRGEMAAGGRSDYPNPFWIELPFPGPGPHRAHRSRGILKHHRMAVPARAKPIFQDKTCDPLLVKKTSIVDSLMLRQHAIPATRANHYSRPCSFSPFSQIRSEGGDILVFLP